MDGIDDKILDSLWFLLFGFIGGFLVGWILFHPRDGGDYEQATPVHIHPTPTSTVILRLPLTARQVLRLARHVGNGGRLTYKELLPIMSKGRVGELRRELLARRLVELDGHGRMIPTAEFTAFLKCECDAARTTRNERNNSGQGAGWRQ